MRWTKIFEDFEYFDKYVVYEFLSFEVFIARSVVPSLTAALFTVSAEAITRLEAMQLIITKIAIKLRNAFLFKIIISSFQ